jgi:hypothetical protein
MKKLEVLYKNLEEYKNFDENDTYSELFLDTVDEIVARKDSSSILVLLSYFDDENDYSWVFEELLGSIESYPDEEYIIALLKNYNFAMSRGKMYVCSLFFHILNSQNHLNLLKKHIHLADKQSLLELFNLMEEESPHHKELIQDLKKLL